ncbi:hypothetical protein FC83_GL002328 [Agrilactobacillus composti DSM 18527 = JCM 14202]|uniref:Phosphoglycerate mutase n=1 Tax=Agrilactobacillus composti DSM 18527 = JCM 14202 TaxID=1423734 RepID=X0PSR3_9LACO|nr:histidine phosphatase family protein [Agrilactobacillus composti]KRM33898.1 hypothetical protein FC83_GL002328 [Agrilactobacillus composti DSM 18527 = JCM 14202]GAF40957.1 phosphoglycerate mutase family 5 [Agrilactobacillus composti DSM 18527 = JCM 14202]
MTTFYFVRHGRTILNQEQRFNGGHMDSPLTPEGIAGAIATGRMLAQTRFDQILVSPLRRAVTTARVIIKRSYYNPLSDIQVDPRLREIDLGDWDGQPLDKAKHFPGFDAYFNHPDQFDPSINHSEGYVRLLQRANAVIKDYDRPDLDKVLIVSHGVLLTALLNQLTGGDLKDMRKNGIIKNASVTVLESRPQLPFEKIGYNVVAETLASQPALQQYFS